MATGRLRLAKFKKMTGEKSKMMKLAFFRFFFYFSA
ncbi:pheST operon leader peptide PheM [Xenorhabdus beddingii]